MTSAIPEEVPLVDMVIAIHDATRPLERGILSLLDQGLRIGSELRITVVCHNVAVAEVRENLSELTSGAVRFLELFDNIPSPAGPFNRGLADATATYVSIMGSDDLLEPGALRAWVDQAQSEQLTAVIAAIQLSDGRKVRTPPHRPARTRRLHPVKDRLAYRSAPLGLFRRDAIARLGLHFTVGVRTGEDQLFSLKLWYSGESIAYARRSPRYRGGDGQQSRVTETARELSADLRALELVITDPWFVSRTLAQRRAIVAKVVRIHVFGIATQRSVTGSWLPGERTYLASFLRDLRSAAPGHEYPFSVADRKLLDALSSPDVPAGLVDRLARQRRQFGSPATLLTRDIRGLVAREGPIRFMVASALV